MGLLAAWYDPGWVRFTEISYGPVPLRSIRGAKAVRDLAR
jgi:hypothetical protein